MENLSKMLNGEQDLEVDEGRVAVLFGLAYDGFPEGRVASLTASGRRSLTERELASERVAEFDGAAGAAGVVGAAGAAESVGAAEAAVARFDVRRLQSVAEAKELTVIAAE